MIRAPFLTTANLGQTRPDRGQALLTLGMQRGAGRGRSSDDACELGDGAQFLAGRVLGSQFSDLPDKLPPAHRGRRTLHTSASCPPGKDQIDSRRLPPWCSRLSLSLCALVAHGLREIF